MKRFIAFILILCAVVSLVSCGNTLKRPLITSNADIPEPFSSVVGGNDYLPVQRSWDDWEQRVSDGSTVVLRVKKISSTSYYWNDKNGVGGITDTTVEIQSVLLGEVDRFKDFSVGGEFHLVEMFTVDKKGNIISPKYTLKEKSGSADNSTEFAINHDERTNPIMKIGEEYIICLWNGWLMSEYGLKYSLECSFDGEKTSVVPYDFYSAGYLRYDAFEYGEAAYSKSSAIVKAYTDNGKSREADSYNLYHAMVKEAFELFSEK